MNRKKIALTALVSIIILILGGMYYIFVIDSPSRIAINDIEEHIKYQENHSKTLTSFQYEKILRENPQSTYANYYVARLIRDDDENRALLLSKKGISLDTNFGYNYLIIMYLHYMKGNDKESLIYLNIAQDKGIKKDIISCYRIRILASMCTYDNKFEPEKLEKIFSSYNSNYSLNALKDDLNYCISNGYRNLNDYKGMFIDCETFLENCKLIEENLENKRNLEKLCSQSSHGEFLENRFTSLGNRIIEMRLIKEMQDCVYMWNVTVINTYGSLSQCNILTGLSSNGDKLEILKTNCYTP